MWGFMCVCVRVGFMGINMCGDYIRVNNEGLFTFSVGDLFFIFIYFF